LDYQIWFVKDWVLEIKGIADSDRFDRVVILFTGSPFGIKVHTQELIGRNIEGNRYFLRPLSFRDFVLQVCQQPGYLTSDKLLEKELEILPENLSSRRINLEEPLEIFGSRSDFRGLADEIEEPISHPTVIDYLRLMEDNFLVQVLYSYDPVKKRVRYKAMKKIYFTDSLIFHSFK
jgi:predicted AAA+ superfamily ATPase